MTVPQIAGDAGGDEHRNVPGTPHVPGTLGSDSRASFFSRRFIAANLVLLAAVALVIGLVGPRWGSRPDAVAGPARATTLLELVTALPDAVGQWRGFQGDFSQTVADVLRYDWSAARTYLRGSEAISLYVFRSRDEKAFLLRAHTPPVCALTQGWQNVVVEPEQITVAGATVASQRMVAEKDGVRRVTFYWEFEGQHVDGRGRQVADTFTVQANMLVRTNVEAAAQTMREFLAEMRPSSEGVLVAQKPGGAGAGEGVGRLLTLDLTSRALRPGATLEAVSLWNLPAAGYVVAQLVTADDVVWAEQRSAVEGNSRDQTIHFALAVPAAVPVGRYDLKLTLRAGPDSAPQPFLNPEGNLAGETLEPFVVKPVRLLSSPDLPCANAPAASFGAELALLCHQALASIQAGQTLTLTLYWQAQLQPQHDYVGFVRLRDTAGRIVVEQNGEPLNGAYSTSAWERGEIVEDVRALRTKSLAPGLYQLEVGIFSFWDMRGQAVQVGQQSLNDFRLTLGTLVVKPSPPPDVSALPAERRVNADLGGRIALLGYDLSWPSAGRALTVTLYWQATSALDTDYTVFVHLLDQAGQIAAQHDGWPLAGRYPTSAWDQGEIVADAHTLDTSGLASGAYQVAVGMYDLATLQRLPITVDGRRVPEDRLFLLEFTLP
ncbi:MAG: exosortase-associated EpsI family protein [Chloroflexi bacterium]|nr:exosortase-associated EpsI family protein [Chloroflexota bacterium]